MALLNLSPTYALPTTMWALTRAITANGRCTEEELLRQVSPVSLQRAAKDQVPTDESAATTPHCLVALRALRDLGMVRDAEGRLAWIGATPNRYSEFSQQLRNAIFASENFTDVADRRNAKGSRDLLRGLTWFLTKDPTGRPWTWREVFQDPNAGTDDNTRVFVNEIRWNGFRYWVEALGLGESEAVFSDRPGALTPAPTRAVRDTILGIYRKGNEVPVNQLLDDLRERLPVLPGGAIAQALNWSTSDDFLDPATSYALEAGALRGWLRLETRADADRSVLLADLSRTGRHRSVTHVIVKDLIDV
ncbi:hypothetical protein GCM10027451_33000 [Geodermatophilus aquaeductus]|uniref:Uncharacterized protein n=1 Tax=Geodermatophilus aquaeductus TaxID=1564161 RepID=A0A521EYV5_9ACTN|nr:protein DpdG [Geodermatophilus aquaeductus]SMO89089.1 hypothetical protein SAMN06273567_106142 [Geodermatophilus aquaeductus]